jgi:pimeloyl-ACP methyl ester carboxylesterase
VDRVIDALAHVLNARGVDAPVDVVGHD